MKKLFLALIIALTVASVNAQDKVMSSGMTSTSAALTTGAITGLNAISVKLKITKSEMMKSGMDFAERTRRVVRGKRGNFISNSPCERWSRDHQPCS